MRLVRFDGITREAYYEYIEEILASGEPVSPSAIINGKLTYEELKEYWELASSWETCEPGLVPATLYYLVDARGRICGAIQFRHELNDFLEHFGGHIGYGVRPTERRKGYATLMLRHMLAIARNKGYESVLITCHDDNIGSAKTIENNGGKEYTTSTYEGKLFRQYWVEV